MIECEHDWVEGGNRDAGRYHCRRCYQCMRPLDIVRERDEARAKAAEAATFAAHVASGQAATEARIRDLASSNAALRSHVDALELDVMREHGRAEQAEKERDEARRALDPDDGPHEVLVAETAFVDVVDELLKRGPLAEHVKDAIHAHNAATDKLRRMLVEMGATKEDE